MASKTAEQLREDALAIWRAGVAAVDSARLVREQVIADRDRLLIRGHEWRPADSGRICVVGAGKAGAGMAAGLEEALGENWLSRTEGWINVPADCIRPLKCLHLHAARPAGVNEPTAEGVQGTEQILDRVRQLGPDDLCLVLISGGGSALLPAPVEGITLADKQQVTRMLMRSGATIDQLNCVRRELSRVKGGGLLRACRAGTLIALIISDVSGDPLETIASGPTVDVPPDPQAALSVLQQVQRTAAADFPAAVLELLKRRQTTAGEESRGTVVPRYWNHVIGNNRTAVDAAADEAARLGYEVRLREWNRGGIAADCGRQLAERARQLRTEAGSGELLCLISGGEPTVHVVRTDQPQRGGRNQELVLAAVDALLADGGENLVLLSGGTDGEDGPTDAAGAWLDAGLIGRVRTSGEDPRTYLDVNNSSPFFEKFGGLIRTGPTHTNVMDLRVAVVAGR